MKNKSIKLYTIIFPIWILWFIPHVCIQVLFIDFIIDLLVLYLTMKCLKVKDIKNNIKSVILKVLLVSFVTGILGTIFMSLSDKICSNCESPFKEWWYDNIINNLMYYGSYKSIYSFLWVTACIIITSIFIYVFNYNYSLKKSNFDNIQRKKIALSLAIFTAPYMSYLPTFKL